MKNPKYNKNKVLRKISRELLPIKPTTVIKHKKRFLLNEAVRLAEEEEWEYWKKNSEKS